MVSVAIDGSKQNAFDEDTILVERFLAGDDTAFQDLYTRYYEKVFSISRGILLDSDEAADAVQEVFFVVYRNLHKFDRRSKFSTWLFRVAVNRTIQESRKNRHRKKNVELTEAVAGVYTEELENRRSKGSRRPRKAGSSRSRASHPLLLG